MKDSIPMPIIEQFCLEDKTPTEPKIPLSGDNYQTAINVMIDVAILAGQSFSEMVEETEPKDRELAKLCREAYVACDRIVSYLVSRSL